MAATVTIDTTISLGQSHSLYLGSAVIGTYATGGVAFDVAGNERFDRVITGGSGYVMEFIPSSQLLKIYRQKDPANAGGADIALTEVANSVDLSGVTVQFTGIGQ